MPRVKRSVHARKKRRKVLEQAKGYWGLKKHELQVREGAGRALALVRVPRPQGQEARVPQALDHAHQRGRTRERALVQPVHRGPEGSRDRARPQGARRSRGQRSGHVRRHRRAGQAGARQISGGRQAEIFSRQAVYCDGRSPLYADLCRRLAVDPRVGALAPDLTLGLPAAPARRRCTTCARRARCRGTTSAARSTSTPSSWRGSRAEQDVQTNEVQRAWALLPGFLTVADGRPFDLLELGPSAGLNLVWDRYRYRYATGDVGEGALELAATTGRRRRPSCCSAPSRSRVGAASTSTRSTRRPTTARGSCRRSSGPTRPSGSSGCGARSRRCGPTRPS